MAVTFLGLVIGDNGTGFTIPTLAQWRDALASEIRQLRGIANLQTNPGSLFGDFIDLVASGADVSAQSASEAVSRTVFTAMKGLALDQFLSDILTRVQASASTATVWVYGSGGANVPISTPVRTSPTAPAFSTLAAVAVPALPAEAYGIEIREFGAGAYNGQTFTVTIAGTPVSYLCNNADTGETVWNGLINAINATPGLTQEAYRGGINPTNGRLTIILVEGGGGGAFALSVSNGGAPAIFSFPAISVSTSTGAVTGPTYAPAQSLRYGTPFAGVQGYTNIVDAVPGNKRETDSEFRARHQVTQRGLGGGSPDAIRGVMLSSTAVGGGGLTFCSVEYNPTDEVDKDGNLPHSVRVVANADADPQALGRALWRSKAAGDNTNGPYSVVVTDFVGNNQTVYYDLLQDLWIGIQIEVVIGPGWPNTGNPLDQLRQDVTDYVNQLQAGGSAGKIRVNILPISTFPNGQPRGVVNFKVRMGPGPQGGPYVYLAWYPTDEPNADAASVPVTSRQKTKAQFVDVTATIVDAII